MPTSTAAPRRSPEGVSTRVASASRRAATRTISFILNCVATQSYSGFGANADDYATDNAGNPNARQYYVNCLSYNNYHDGMWIYVVVSVYLYNCVFALNNGDGIYSFCNQDGDNAPTRPTRIYSENTIFYQNQNGTGNADLLLGNPSINGNPLAPMYVGDYNGFDQGGGSEGLLAYNYIAPIASGSATTHLQLLYIAAQSGCLGGRKRSGQPFGRQRYQRLARELQ